MAARNGGRTPDTLWPKRSEFLATVLALQLKISGRHAVREPSRIAFVQSTVSKTPRKLCLLCSIQVCILDRREFQLIEHQYHCLATPGPRSPHPGGSETAAPARHTGAAKIKVGAHQRRAPQSGKDSAFFRLTRLNELAVIVKPMSFEACESRLGHTPSVVLNGSFLCTCAHRLKSGA